VGQGIYEEVAVMSVRQKLKYVHEGHYVAEVAVDFIESKTGWSPTMSLEDAYKLDDVRAALKAGDLKTAEQYGRVYELRPVKHAQ
jgi:hypothetical protein